MARLFSNCISVNKSSLLHMLFAIALTTVHGIAKSWTRLSDFTFVIGIGLKDSKSVLNYFYICLYTGNFFLTGSLGYIQPHLLPVTENFTFDPNSGLLFLLSPPPRLLRL